MKQEFRFTTLQKAHLPSSRFLSSTSYFAT